MKWITLFAFFSLIFGCWAPDPEDKDLKPLNIPEEIEMDDDRTSLMNIFRTFNINYLRSKFKPPSKEASISQRLWSTASQFVDTYKALYRTDKFPSKFQLAYQQYYMRLLLHQTHSHAPYGNT